MAAYENLIAWQKAMDLVTQVYAATKSFPREEIFGLTSQLRRAAVSVPSNIAEGKGRLSRREYRQFLAMARGSLQEIATQVRIAANLGYLNSKHTSALVAATEELGRILSGLLGSIPST